MADAIAAVANEKGGLDQDTVDVFSFIAAHQESERRWTQGLMDGWLTDANTALLLTRHAVNVALNNCDYGGTTRDYDETLHKISKAVNGANRWHPAWEFYRQQVEEAHGMLPVDEKVWPGFRVSYDDAWG
jgi:hypothetical protein